MSLLGLKTELYVVIDFPRMLKAIGRIIGLDSFGSSEWYKAISLYMYLRTFTLLILR